MKIAIVDDEKDMRQSISQWLALSGFDTETFASAEEALKGLGNDFPGIVVSDIKMPGILISDTTIPGKSLPSTFNASSALAKASVSKPDKANH